MSCIPKNIFQTHKSLVYVNSKPKLYNAVNSWRKFSNDFNYYFYNNSMCDKFIQENFNEETYIAYNMLPMGVMKADLWRYCVIYINGGIYADVDTICNVDPNIFIGDAELIVSPEFVHPYFCQWTFAAPAGSPILKSIIDLSIERIFTIPIKGENIVHYLTGPEVFTDGIENYLKNNNLPTFDNKLDYFNYPSPILRVFNPYNFHDKFIRHLFAGSDNDGWKKERYVKLVK